ncbi:MAG: choice-of-anchor R domain-containing protein [bacterium]
MKSNLLVMVFVVIVLLIMSMIGCTKSTTSLAAVPTVCGFIAGHNANDETTHATNGILLGVSFTASTNLSLKSISAKFDNAGSFALGVYSDSAGLPGTLLGQTLEQQSVIGWNSVTLTPISIISGTKYWLVVGAPGASIYLSAVAVYSSIKMGSFYSALLPTNPTPADWTEVYYLPEMYASGCN